MPPKKPKKKLNKSVNSEKIKFFCEPCNYTWLTKKLVKWQIQHKFFYLNISVLRDPDAKIARYCTSSAIRMENKNLVFTNTLARSAISPGLRKKWLLLRKRSDDNFKYIAFFCLDFRLPILSDALWARWNRWESFKTNCSLNKRSEKW